MSIVFVEKNGLKGTDWKAIENYQSYNMPILYLSGNIAGMTKEDAVTLNYIYQDRAGTCTLKWQGSSSLSLPKKNYTIKFDNAFEVVTGWGAQKKYVLKANFVDSSHARNIVCAKMWGQIVKSRTPANATLNALPNGGAIDGFPIIISLNGVFHGLYTWNIPKDAWMFGMDGTGRQAIVCAELNDNGAVAFKGLALLDESDFSLEYSSDGQSAWVVESLNRLLGVVKDSDGTNITYGITPYIDWESAIDYYIHATLTSNYDGIWRNYLLATYDGVKWFFTGYDMDVVLGLRAMGRYFYPANHSAVSFETVAGMHKLFELIWKYMRPQLRARYNELRESVLSVENVTNMFIDFTADIPLPIYVDDVRRWSTIPSSGANNIAQIITNYDLRCRNADKWIEDTSGETALPEQVNPTVPTLSNISVTYTGGDVPIGTELTALTGITVTATYSDGSKSTVTGYSLSGTIAEGENTITVTYGGKTTTITVIGVDKQESINKVPTSVDTDGSLFNNGKGYIGRTRLSSSGGTKYNDYMSTTGYISAKSGDVIRMKGAPFDSGTEYICVYDSSFNRIGHVCGTGLADAIGTAVVNGDLVTLTLAQNSNIAWIRGCLTHDSSCSGYASVADPYEGPGSYMIITVNEEIV